MSEELASNPRWENRFWLTQLHMACDGYYFGSAIRPRFAIVHIAQHGIFQTLVFRSPRLVTLSLRPLPTDTHSSHPTPEMMVTYLAASRPLPIDSPDPRRPTRPQSSRFQGASKYLEDFVALLDTTSLNNLTIVFFIHNIFHAGHLCEFIARAEIFKPLEQVCIELPLLVLLHHPSIATAQPSLLENQMQLDEVGGLAVGAAVQRPLASPLSRATARDPRRPTRCPSIAGRRRRGPSLRSG